jgi:hypothetical protein
MSALATFSGVSWIKLKLAVEDRYVLTDDEMKAVASVMGLHPIHLRPRTRTRNGWVAHGTEAQEVRENLEHRREYAFLLRQWRFEERERARVNAAMSCYNETRRVLAELKKLLKKGQNT